MRGQTRQFVSPLRGIATILGLMLVGCAGDPHKSWVDEMLHPEAVAPESVALAGNPQAHADRRRRALLRMAGYGQGGRDSYLTLYRAILAQDQADPTVRGAAAGALVRHGRPADADAIAALLAVDEPFTRWQAAVELQRLHDPSVVPDLIAALGADEDSDVRMAAARALGQYPRRDVFDSLVRALDDLAYGVGRAARASLVLITDHDAGRDPGDWLAHAQQNPRTLFAQPRRFTYPTYWREPGWLASLIHPFADDSPRRLPPKGYSPPDGES